MLGLYAVLWGKNKEVIYDNNQSKSNGCINTQDQDIFNEVRKDDLENQEQFVDLKGNYNDNLDSKY